MKKYLNPKIFTVAALILTAALSRFVPHPPNFTPILAMALFGGAMLGDKKLSLIVPLAAMLLSDIFIGFHADMPAVYLSFIAITLIGGAMIKSPKVTNVIAGSLVAAVLFFVVTNFSSWLMWEMYPKTLSGLLLSYEAAIPFFRNTMIATLVFSGVMFGAFKLIENVKPAWISSENN